MEFIAYDVKIDIANLLTKGMDKCQDADKERNRQFNANKKKLLPIICKFLHYMAEIQNNLEWQDTSTVCTRPNSIRGIFTHDKIDNIEEFIQRNTQDCFFEDNGATWKQECFAFGKKICIWLHGHGKHVNNYDDIYSMLGFDTTYCKNPEEYAQQVIAKATRIAATKLNQ